MALAFRDIVRIILGFSSVVIGMFFLSKSSFSDLQFSVDESARATAFSFLTAVFMFFLFVGRDLKNFVAGPRVAIAANKHFLMNCFVMLISFATVCVLGFLIKHPRFNIHSDEYTRQCINEQTKIMNRVKYNLFSYLAFAVLALIISFKRKRPSQLGFFANLLGLIIDTSMEIKGNDGPNLWYICGSALGCMVLIILRCYAEKSNREGIEDARQDRGSRKFKILTCLGFLAAVLGSVFLSQSSFAKLQFEGLVDLEIIFFCVYTLFLGACLLKLPDWMDSVVKMCRSSWIVKAAVNSLLLMIVSAMNFLNKYPRFKVHSPYRNSCTEKERRKITHGILFELYSAGTFSFFALVVSSDQHQVELGMFNFLLQLTMDVAIETLDKEVPKVLIILGALAYCVALISLKAWLSTLRLGEVVRGPAGSVDDLAIINVDGAGSEHGQFSDGTTEMSDTELEDHAKEE